MYSYHPEEELNFGKYKGRELEDVIAEDPSYIEWCVLNVHNFYLSPEVIEMIKENIPSFSLSEDALWRLKRKYNDWLDEQASNNDHDYRQSQRDEFDVLTDGNYGEYDEWRESDGDIDHLKDSLGY